MICQWRNVKIVNMVTWTTALTRIYRDEENARKKN